MKLLLVGACCVEVEAQAVALLHLHLLHLLPLVEESQVGSSPPTVKAGLDHKAPVGTIQSKK